MSVNGRGSRFRRMLFGYARVSTADQNPDHQIDALLRAGVSRENIYLDKASGAKASRPKFDLVLQLLREGDTLKVTRLDRLSRSVLHLVTLGAELREREIGLHVIEQGIDTATAEGRAMFGMLSVLAELQRELILANTMDGLASARARVRHDRGERPVRPREALGVGGLGQDGPDGGRREPHPAALADQQAEPGGLRDVARRLDPSGAAQQVGRRPDRQRRHQQRLAGLGGQPAEPLDDHAPDALRQRGGPPVPRDPVGERPGERQGEVRVAPRVGVQGVHHPDGEPVAIEHLR
ncbi:recombinase family protein [Actinomadura roseirufa]|uniref:recombinase family protein n=1 Tax=Actinomadura roseirufa TaxID=2094049 RepID=UPI00352175B4